MPRGKKHTMSLHDFNDKAGVRGTTSHDDPTRYSGVCYANSNTDGYDRPLQLPTSSPYCRFTSYIETDACHRYYAGDDMWNALVEQQDWKTIAQVFEHIVNMMEVDEQENPSLRWGSHSTFPQLCRILVKRLEDLRSNGLLNDTVRRGAGKFHKKADQYLSSKQANMPFWRDSHLFLYDD